MADRRALRPTNSLASEARTVQFGSEHDSDDDEADAENVSVNIRMRHEKQVATKMHTHVLPQEVANLFGAVVDKAAEALGVIRGTLGLAYLDQQLHFVPLEEKIESEAERVIMPSNFAEMVYDKFRKDICWVEKILRVTGKDLRSDWHFDEILRILKDYQITIEDERALLMAKSFNQSEILKLRIRQEVERENFLKNIQKLTEAVGNSKDELNDLMEEYNVKIRFLKNWERARHEQNTMMLRGKEDSLMNITRKTTIEFEREKRVHQELNDYLKESIADYKHEVDMWMMRYEEELDDYEMEINRKKADLDMQKEKRLALKERYEYHKELIEDYKEEKLRRQKEAEEKERRYRSAIKIQSWWRGIMFRKGLGPFRRKKGKGKRGASGKKGGSGVNSGKKKK